MRGGRAAGEQGAASSKRLWPYLAPGSPALRSIVSRSFSFLLSFQIYFLFFEKKNVSLR